MYKAFVDTLLKAESVRRNPIRWEIPGAWVRAMERCNHPYFGNAEKLTTLLGVPVVEISNTKSVRLFLETSKEDSIPLVD